MSYILEALKKAQAERQLGATPTIHAPTLDAVATRRAPGLPWKPLALAAGAVVIAGAAALAWREQAAPAAPAAPVPAALVGQAPAVAAVPAAPGTGAAAAAAAAAAASAPAPAAAVAPAVAPPAEPPAPPPGAAAGMPASPPAAKLAVAGPAALPQAATPVQAAPAPLPAQLAAAEAVKPAPAKPAPAAVAEVTEEPVQLLRDLPEPIQRSIPPITMGGYMYSKNPADRLVLIDKILRREGEEVAPGLVLEKLLPKAAIFTFKGYRYRVPY